jgi:chromosome segregation ATPase
MRYLSHNITSVVVKSRDKASAEQRYRKVHQQTQAERMFGGSLLGDLSSRFAGASGSNVRASRAGSFLSSLSGDERKGEEPKKVNKGNDKFTLLNEVKHHEVDLSTATEHLTTLRIEEEQIKAAATRTSDEIANLSRTIQAMEKEVSHLKDDLEEQRARNGVNPDWPTEGSADTKQIAAALRNLQEKRQKRYEQAGLRRNSIGK